MDSRRKPTFYKESKLAEFLKKRIKLSKKKHREIAEMCEYNHPNNIAMITTGKSKVALNKIPLFAKALAVDEGYLFGLALKEYDPTVFKLLQRNSIIVSHAEKEMIEEFRAVIENEHIIITERSGKLLKSAFEQIKRDNELIEASNMEELEEALFVAELPKRDSDDIFEQQIGEALDQPVNYDDEVAAELDGIELQSKKVAEYWDEKK